MGPPATLGTMEIAEDPAWAGNSRANGSIDGYLRRRDNHAITIRPTSLMAA